MRFGDHLKSPVGQRDKILLEGQGSETSEVLSFLLSRITKRRLSLSLFDLYLNYSTIKTVGKLLHTISEMDLMQTRFGRIMSTQCTFNKDPRKLMKSCQGYSFHQGSLQKTKPSGTLPVYYAV